MATHIYEIPAWQPIANQLARLGICTLADIQGPTSQLTTPLKDHLPQFPPLPLPLDTAATTLPPNQFWMPYGRTERSAVLKIVSSTPTATLYRKWYPTEPDKRLGPGRRICWTPSDYRNPPSQYSLLTDDERTLLTTRILVNPPRKYIGRAKSRTIVGMFATTPPVFMTPRVTPEQRDQIGPLEEEVQHAILQLGPYDIITDGGWIILAPESMHHSTIPRLRRHTLAGPASSFSHIIGNNRAM